MRRYSSPAVSVDRTGSLLEQRQQVLRDRFVHEPRVPVAQSQAETGLDGLADLWVRRRRAIPAAATGGRGQGERAFGLGFVIAHGASSRPNLQAGESIGPWQGPPCAKGSNWLA